VADTLLNRENVLHVNARTCGSSIKNNVGLFKVFEVMTCRMVFSFYFQKAGKYDFSHCRVLRVSRNNMISTNVFISNAEAQNHVLYLKTIFVL